MKPLPHRYDVRLSGGPAGDATLTVPGVPDLRSAPPPAYDGPGDAWSPEHLLVAAVEACFLFTLRAVARASKLEFSDVHLDTTGIVDRQDGVVRFTEIALRCHLAVEPGTDRERAMRVLARAEKACLVSASLSTPIRVEAEIEEAVEPGLMLPLTA
jgi:peroxiredoxin-like protein